MKKILTGTIAGFIASLVTVMAVYAASVTVYDNIPNPIPGNVPSLGYEATSTSEFGGQVMLASTERFNPTVTVLMSSWACESGHWSHGNCVTSDGATFSHPITLNFYEVGPGDSVGTLISTKTESFDMPYRPSSDAINCSGGAWHDGSSCYNGKAFTINFDFPGLELPDKVIVGVAYNTSHYGAAPIGTGTACFGTEEGCPYDSLNVGTNPTPSVGSSMPTSDDAYWDTLIGGWYCDGGLGGSGTFRLDAGCWTGFLPSFKIDANPPEVIASVNGGGHILEEIGDKKKDWHDISFGGQINVFQDNSLTGEWEVNFHNVSNDEFDKANFHSTEVTSINFFNGDSDSCNDAVNFTMMGELNGEPGYKMIFRGGDNGSPNNIDTVRIELYKGVLIYDTSTADFDMESDCVGTARTGLDTGNITIQH